MKIGIISDSHDHLEPTQKAIGQLSGSVEILLHCGDFCAPFMMAELAQFDGDVHCVFGNTDDRHSTTLKAQKHGIHLHGDVAVLSLGGKTIAMNHFPEIARAMAMSGQFDVVCYGHTHKKHEERFGKTLLVNPGELMGRKGSQTYAIYDTETDEVEFFEL